MFTYESKFEVFDINLCNIEYVKQSLIFILNPILLSRIRTPSDREGEGMEITIFGGRPLRMAP